MLFSLGLCNFSFYININFYVFSSQIGNGATFVKVDRINNTKDNSPALLFQGAVRF